MRRIALLLLVLSAMTYVGCGDGSLVLVDSDGDTQDTIQVEGNIRDVNPEVAGASILVFVFTNLSQDNLDNGKLKFNADGTLTFDKQRSVAVDSDAETSDFTVTRIESGNLTVVFLQDDVGDPDGTLDPGDPNAVLSDSDNVLENVRNGETIRATDVDIDFRADEETAKAESIRSVRSDDGTQ